MSKGNREQVNFFALSVLKKFVSFHLKLIKWNLKVHLVTGLRKEEKKEEQC